LAIPRRRSPILFGRRTTVARSTIPGGPRALRRLAPILLWRRAPVTWRRATLGLLTIARGLCAAAITTLLVGPTVARRLPALRWLSVARWRRHVGRPPPSALLGRPRPPRRVGRGRRRRIVVLVPPSRGWAQGGGVIVTLLRWRARRAKRVEVLEDLRALRIKLQRILEPSTRRLEVPDAVVVHPGIEALLG